MKRRIITTADGSKTIRIEDWDEHYHSINGAIQESNHVFIKNGLHFLCHSERSEESHKNIAILEIGFGTGLNAFITYLEALKQNLSIDYVGVEAFPISKEEIAELNYAELLSIENESVFKQLHSISWEEKHILNHHFTFTKRKQLFEAIKDIEKYDLIYFDAFAPEIQPELWTETIFKSMFNALKNNGVLTTYSAKGIVRRAMESVGFRVERLEGPSGKREMLKALKKR